MLSAAGFDGHVDIYSIMGGSNQAQSQRHADQVRLDYLELPSLFMFLHVIDFSLRLNRSATPSGTWILSGWDKRCLRCSCLRLQQLQLQSTP